MYTFTHADFVHRPRPCGQSEPFELEPIMSCEFSAFVLRVNKDRYYGIDTARLPHEIYKPLQTAMGSSATMTCVM